MEFALGCERDVALQRDVKLIEAALQDEDVREALRSVDGRSSMAPDAKARRVLPKLFPQGRAFAAPAPNAPDESDVRLFQEELTRAVRYSARRRGPGPGALSSGPSYQNTPMHGIA